MPTISLNGQTGSGRSPIINSQRTVNLYPEVTQDGQSIALVGVPGTSLFSTMTTSTDIIRAMRVFNGLLFVVAGNHLYEVATNGSITATRGTLGTSTGAVYMTDNNVSPAGADQLFITDGTNGYIYNQSTHVFTTLANNDATHASGKYPGTAPSSCCMIDGYLITNDLANGGKFYVSDLNSGLFWNSLNVAASQSISNQLTRVVAFNKQLWLFGTSSVEVWANSGYGYPPFTAISGMTLTNGTIAAASVVEAGNYLAWLTQSRRGAYQVMATTGGMPVPISTPEIEYRIKQFSSVTDAYGFTVQFEGHDFYYISFPTGNATFGYDFTTKMWHERSTWSINQGMLPNVWNVITNVYFNGNNYVGSSTDGKIYTLSSSYYTDYGEPIVAWRQSQAISRDRDYIFHSSLELEMESGVGLDGYGSTEGTASSTQYGGGTDPVIELQWSDDGGQTWGSQHQQSVGKMGEYGKRVLFRRLGKSRNRVYRYILTDPVKRIITGSILHYQQSVNP